MAACSPLTKAVALLAAADPKSNTPVAVSDAGLPEGRTTLTWSPGLTPKVSANSLPTMMSPAPSVALPATSRPEMS